MKLTPKQLAELCNLNINTAKHYMSGLRKMPDEVKAVKTKAERYLKRLKGKNDGQTTNNN